MASINPAVMMRSYSLLHVKEFNEEPEYVTVRGTATSPIPDRLNDVIEPLGAKFAAEIPLLLYHGNQAPVGLTKLGKATKKGIPFEARLPLVKESGRLKDRVDEAIHSLKYRLIGAVSIGFRVLNDAVEMLENGGIHFLETEILELSLVTIPAHQNATIDSVKSIVNEESAALGNRRIVRASTAGASATKRKGEFKVKTTGEQIATFQTKRAALETRMEAIMEKAAEDGERVLSEEEQQEYDEAVADIGQVDKHLDRLVALETTQMSKAKRVNGQSIDDATNARSHSNGNGAVEGRIITAGRDVLPKGIGFARYARCMMLSRGNRLEALDLAKEFFRDDPRLIGALKANVSAAVAAAGTPAWAGVLVDYQNLTSDFIEYLRPETIIGKFGLNGVPPLHQVPFNVRMIRQTVPGEGYWVGEGLPKPLTAFGYDAVTMLWAKVANIAVLTEELIRFSNPSADNLVRQALVDALRSRLDIDFIDPDKAAAAGVSPASILNGVTPIPSSGTDGDAVRADIQALVAEFTANNTSTSAAVFITDEATALTISMMANPLGQPWFAGVSQKGGSMMGVPLITSQHVPTDGSGHILALVDANSILLADDGGFNVDASREASLQMLDNPTNTPVTPTATSLVSMFQTNSVAIKAERYINWAKARATAASYVSGINYALS